WADLMATGGQFCWPPAGTFVAAYGQFFMAANRQWLPKANARLVRRTGARPTDLLAADKAAMLALPPVPPVTGFTARVRLPRDYYVRMGSNDYSVHPQAIGRFVDVSADLETVTISLDGRPVGTHLRSWGTGLTITDPDHVEAARALRKAFQTPHPVGETTGLRDLADYDRAFGVVLDDGQVA
ncbi:Mu transposase domain-containing protein, partial [Pseudarthrobacter oxydans]|uniref:Mu transposase domain-containing protein n=1 Tax=Pseudarthrobacter oxydans TaxID=1671 RepID=UPI0037FF63F2